MVFQNFELAEITNTEFNVLKKIPVELDVAYIFILETLDLTQDSREIISLYLLPLKVNFIS